LYNQIFLTNILRRMDELGINKNELCRRSGISSAFMTYLTQDKANPSLKVMEKIARALKTPLPDLLELTSSEREAMAELIYDESQLRPLDDYVHISVTLNEFQAHQARLWDTANKKKLQANKKKIKK